MSYRAVLFDLDDTLYPYAPCNAAGKRAAREAAAELGYAFDEAAFAEFYAAGREAVKREIGGTAAAHERYLYFKRALELETGRPQPADAHRLGSAYWDGYVDAMAAREGVHETLATLRDAGVALGVVTNLTTRIQLRKLAALELEDAFDAVVTSEEVGRDKPASAPLTLGLARLDRRPSETVVVGDDPVADVAGGAAVGATTALFPADQPEAGTAPDHRLDAMSELTEVVL